jgi:hypothetical protein
MTTVGVAYIVLPLTCSCPGGRRLPLRLMPDALFWLRRSLQDGLMPADMVVQTYRCSNCGTVVEITASDLSLADTCASTGPTPS